jgi:hypothetical protein
MVGGFDSWGDGAQTGTSGAAFSEWVDYFTQLKTGSQLSAVGAAGETIEQITARLSLALADNPSATASILLAGTNNAASQTADDIMGHYADWITATGKPLNFICTIPPPNNAVAQAVNVRLLSGELGSAANIIDLDPILLNAASPSSWRTGYEDAATKHPSELASQRIFSLISKRLEEEAMSVIYAGIPETESTTNEAFITVQDGRADAIAQSQGLTATVPAGYKLTEIGCRVQALGGDEVASVALYNEDGNGLGLPSGSPVVQADISFNETAASRAYITQAYSQPVAAGDYTLATMSTVVGVDFRMLSLSATGAAYDSALTSRDTGLTAAFPAPWAQVSTPTSALWMWAKFEPLTAAPTLTTPYSIGTNNGPLFVATSSDTIATIEGAGFLDGKAGWASLLKTGDVLMMQASNGTKMYNLTVDKQARTIALSTGLTVA